MMNLYQTSEVRLAEVETGCISNKTSVPISLSETVRADLMAMSRSEIDLMFFGQVSKRTAASIAIVRYPAAGKMTLPSIMWCGSQVSSLGRRNDLQRGCFSMLP